MKILITGATGYVGHPLALKLASQGNIVHILVRDLGSSQIPFHPNIRVFKGDLTDSKSISTAIQGCIQVFHVAAYARLSSKNPDLFYQINVVGTENVLNEALKEGVQKFVFTSSVAVFGPSTQFPLRENDPRIAKFQNDYELTKSIAESIVKKFNHYGLPTVIVNLSRVYGPGTATYSNGVNKFISGAIHNRYTFIPDKLGISNNYVFIDDAINGHVLAMEKGIAGESYIIGGENISYKQLFETIKRFAGKKTRFISIPYPLIYYGLSLIYFFSKLIFVKETISPKILDQLFINRIVSCQKATLQLGYNFTSLDSGIRKTIHSLKQQNHGN
ncbi:MAG: NAD-dependent epimerase/dehydratase family protein [Daejeonella sp.]